MNASASGRMAAILVLLVVVIFGTVMMWWKVYRIAAKETCPTCGGWKPARFVECNACYVQGAIITDEAPNAWRDL